MKTTKWVQAKRNAYDGDDWGDYDEYDEYGVNQEPEPEPPASQRYYAQRGEQSSRNLTDPSPQGPAPSARRNSFEHGEEQRAFPASQAQSSFEPQRPFAPSTLPALQTQTHMATAPLPAATTASPANTQFPPRKSSVGQPDAPSATSPRSRTSSTSEKPLPFIRPADIYKRVEEERVRERASLDSTRPSLDSLSSRPRDTPSSPQADPTRSLQPLETVTERKSEYLPDVGTAFPRNDQQSAPGPSAPAPPHVSLPQPEVAAVFNDEFWSSGPQLYGPNSPAPTGLATHDQGLRSVVDQAFTRKDDQRSVPPTPISRDMNSDMSRSNTGSTSGISPIMSRVPSSAMSALKNRNPVAPEGSTPAIAEDPRETAPSSVTPTATMMPGPAHQIPRKPSPAGSRNLSSTSLPLSGRPTPTHGNSPARSPVIAPQKDIPEPEAAQVTLDTQLAMEGGLAGPSPAYATREADIAEAAKNGPASAAPKLGAVEKLSQNLFLESHKAQSPIEAVVPRDRSESPSKGRVQALAGRFDDTSRERRGSTQSKHSVQSWERSQDHSRAASPTKGSPIKPSSPVKEFRPHLPGGWESYATTVATPLEQTEKNRGLGHDESNVSTPSEDVDLTPTKTRRSLAAIKAGEPDPLAELKNAGAAMGESFRSYGGEDEPTPESPQSQKSHKPHGNMYMPRPLQLDRTISAMSSVPPTPPAKDTPTSEFPPTPPQKDAEVKNVADVRQTPANLPPLATHSSPQEQESDRLRNEIVASLSPVKTTAVPATEPNRGSLQPAGLDANRASSILPSEYDSYWADGDQSSPRLSRDVDRSAARASTGPSVPPKTQANILPQPALLNRFSWEPNTPTNQGPPVTTAAASKSQVADQIPSPIAERASVEERHREPESVSGHAVPASKLDARPDADDAVRSPIVPPAYVDTLSGSTQDHTKPAGLHVVNTKVNPEAVEIPLSISTLNTDPVPSHQDEASTKRQSMEAGNMLATPTSPTQVTEPSTVPEPAAKSPTTDKPLAAREIATICSTSERIVTYNKTRDVWAATDHGLDNWLACTLEANPDLMTQTFTLPRPASGTVRHKQTGSLSILGKLGGSSSQPNQGGESPHPAGAQAPASSTSPTTAAPASSGFGGRVASQQAKGKDLLHTAGVLGGKGVTSAKGLFAKGKSRFGRDKVDK